MFKPSSDNAFIVRTIADACANLPIGGSLTFEDVQYLIGFDVRENRYLLLSALDVFHKETGGVMSSVRGVGYIRLAADQFASAVAHQRNRGRRIFRRTHKTFSRAMECVNDVAPTELAKIGRELAMIGLLSHMARDSVLKMVSDNEKPPSYADTVRATLAAINGVK